MKILYFILPLLILSGCKGYYLSRHCKAVTSTKDSIYIHDTTTVTKTEIKEVVKTIIPEKLSVIQIDELCDSVKGLKSINTVIKNGGQTVSIQSDGKGGITIKCKEDSIMSVNSSLLQRIDSISTRAEFASHQSKSIVQAPLKWYERFMLWKGFWWVLIGSVLLNLFLLRKPLILVVRKIISPVG